MTMPQHAMRLSSEDVKEYSWLTPEKCDSQARYERLCRIVGLEPRRGGYGLLHIMDDLQRATLFTEDLQAHGRFVELCKARYGQGVDLDEIKGLISPEVYTYTCPGWPDEWEAMYGEWLALIARPSKMHLLEMIASAPGRVRIAVKGNSAPDLLSAIARDAPRLAKVSADEVAALYCAARVGTYPIPEGVSIRPGFDSIWIEARLPAHTWMGSRKMQSIAHGVGALVNYLQRLDPLGGAYPGPLLHLAPFIARGEEAYLLPQNILVPLDERGHIAGEMSIVAPEGPGAQDTMIAAHQAADIALLALAFMNCKNVRTETTRTPPKLVKARQKRGRISLEYGVIRLPKAPGAPARREGGSSGMGVALHLMRGHFKTYTRDAPLMGKHVGTYWWPARVRGNPERGARVRSYQVGPPNGMAGEST